MLSDHRHPCFRNFDSVVSIDVIRMKSYLDSLFDPTCVSVRVTIEEVPPFRLRALKLRRFVYEQAVYLCHVLLSCLALLSLFRLYILCRIHMEFCIQHLLVYVLFQ